MNSQKPQDISISVVIPAYNAEQYIGRAIDSILNQSVPVAEIIVVDDGSSDQTAQVVKGYADQVKYIRQDNAGVSAARNTGIKTAQGNWIAFLDADDQWLPDRIKYQVDLLTQHPSLAWIAGNYLRCLCEQQRQKPHLSDKTVENLLNGRPYFENYYDAFLHEAGGHTDTMLIRKDVLIEAGLFAVGQNQMEDMDLWWKIARSHPNYGFVSQPIAIYHLGIPGSLIQSRKDFSACRTMIQSHLDASKNTPQASSVKACSIKMLRGWIRTMFFNKQGDEVKKMLNEFDFLFPWYYKCTARMMLISPALTSQCLHLMSKVVRCLKIRQQLTRKPSKG